MMESAGLKSLIRARADALGFVSCRVTRPRVDRMHADALQQWVAADMQGEMTWMAEENRLQRRRQPESMLANVRSVITVAMPYSAPDYGLDEASAARAHGVITAYAHGDDYHDVMKKRLKALAAELDALLGRHDQRVFVDTAPVLEHALAERAGLGWQGKHSLTIDRRLGSWFLLGEIFTTAELEGDEAALNHCGSCSACMDICPTGAIVAPYVVDARLCISYLTIEFDGFIPRHLRPLMGNRIYGCDDCQLVCPWNGYAAKGAGVLRDRRIGPSSASRPDPEADPLRPRRENHLPDLASLLRLDEDGFRQRFRKSPVRRTKRRGLLRNVCIAMGNSGQVAFVDALMSSLQDGEPLIRGHAAWALGRLAHAQNRQAIIRAMTACAASEANQQVLEEVETSIRQMNKTDGVT